MLKKVCQWLFGLCFSVGLLLVICTAGASDCDSISLYQIIVRNLIALVFMLIGFIGLKLSGAECMR